VGANNYELKKRRIAVTLADSRVRARNRFVLGSVLAPLVGLMFVGAET
jgi:hypothetical protein